MPTAQYTALANVTLTGTASSVTFSSISGSYRDLLLVISPIWDGSGNTQMQGRLNGDTGNNYMSIFMEGTGSTYHTNTYNNTVALFSYNFGTLSTTAPAPLFINVMDYSATDKHKLMLTRNNSSGSGVVAGAHKWANTAAVTSIQILCGFGIGSSFSLYGVK